MKRFHKRQIGGLHVLRVQYLIAVLTLALAVPQYSFAQIKLSGGGKYKDRDAKYVRPFSTFPSLVRLGNGTLLCYDRASSDGGKTWHRHKDFGFPLADATRRRRGSITTLKDGTVLLVGRYTHRHERKPNVYVAEIYRSRNNFGGYTGPKRAMIHLPNVVAGTDEYGMPVSGPMFEQTIVELPGGDLVASMWGWFASDQTPSGYPDLWKKWQLKKSRAFLIRSKDRGRTWHYVSTIAADPKTGPEGFRLPSLGLLPDGQLLCLLRNGDGDRPLLLTRSKGDYTRWEKPKALDARAVYGQLLVLSDGTVLLAYGKPLYIVASDDGGRTWQTKTKMNIGTRTGQAFIGRIALAEVSPGKVVCVYHDVLDLLSRVLTVSKSSNSRKE